MYRSLEAFHLQYMCKYACMKSRIESQRIDTCKILDIVVLVASPRISKGQTRPSAVGVLALLGMLFLQTLKALLHELQDNGRPRSDAAIWYLVERVWSTLKTQTLAGHLAGRAPPFADGEITTE